MKPVKWKKLSKVDSDGCMITKQTITFNNINFELNSAEITASSGPSLNRVAKALKAQQNFNVEIAGHTDSTGSASYNEKLSDERAKSVRQYLIEQGIDADRLTAADGAVHHLQLVAPCRQIGTRRL